MLLAFAELRSHQCLFTVLASEYKYSLTWKFRRGCSPGIHESRPEKLTIGSLSRVDADLGASETTDDVQQYEVTAY